MRKKSRSTHRYTSRSISTSREWLCSRLSPFSKSRKTYGSIPLSFSIVRRDDNEDNDENEISTTTMTDETALGRKSDWVDKIDNHVRENIAWPLQKWLKRYFYETKKETIFAESSPSAHSVSSVSKVTREQTRIPRDYRTRRRVFRSHYMRNPMQQAIDEIWSRYINYSQAFRSSPLLRFIPPVLKHDSVQRK